ncbi:MAG TPA: MarR family transcriptional regulator [Pyrinomonadaceae bacterium]|jgi:DNA-binding MarR family transcriptional regulator
MRIEGTVSFMLSRVTTAFRNSLERNMSAVGLHSGQVFILFELWKKDGQRQVDLAARLAVTTPTINKMLLGLIDAGLVDRMKLENDNRATRIFLTEAGASLKEPVETQWHELEENTVAGLTEAERLIIFELLTKMKNLYAGESDED